MSMIQDSIKAKGQLSIVVTGADGQVKENYVVPNLVVTVGKNFIASRMKDTGSPTQMTHMAIGSGSTAADVGDSTLGTQLGTRASLATAGGTVSNNVVTYQATFVPGNGTGAVTEAGIFNASTGGTMLCRTVFAVVNKGADDTMTITWTVTIS